MRVIPEKRKPDYKVAIVGSGPAGIYAAEMISRHQLVKEEELRIAVDLIDQLPTPYGLIRYGVAPDHPRIKGIVDSLHKILSKNDARFTGNIRFGADLTLDELRVHYDAVVFATGASQDAVLDIPGTRLKGFHGASQFVSWYDGHPEASHEWPLDAEHVAVIGNGNVALDIARMLAKDPETLTTTELPDHIQRALEGSAVKRVHVFGRRGPADVKFTPLELRELGDQPGVSVVVEADDHTLSHWPTPETLITNQSRQNLATLESWRNNPHVEGNRTVHLHFFHSPVSVNGDEEQVSSITFARTPLPTSHESEEQVEVTYPMGQVYSAVGYRSVPLLGVPFDASEGVIENLEGRVCAGGHPCEGLYATGWIKRGPVGLIGHTKSDAKQTIGHLVDDLVHMKPKATGGDIRSLADSKGLLWTSWEGWLRLDEKERTKGAGYRGPGGSPQPRLRTKETDRQVMIEIGSGSNGD